MPSTTPERLAFFLLRAVNKAVREFAMIRPGDRVAVAVSGGKDSLALLRLLEINQRTHPARYALAAIHVRGDAMGITLPHEPLETWLAESGIPWRSVEPEVGPAEKVPLSCQRCTWLRRKALFLTADELGCNVVAFAHHADDAAQTTLLNLLFGGRLETLTPAADYFDGHFRLIRPLFYVPETDLARFAQTAGFPPPPPTCPRTAHSRRRLVAAMFEMLSPKQQETARINLIRAGLRYTKGGSPHD